MALRDSTSGFVFELLSLNAQRQFQSECRATHSRTAGVALRIQQLDAVAQAGQFGNERRNEVRGPGYGTVDLSLLKSFKMSERWTAQFRAEGFNAFNHTNFGLPVNDLNSPAFGQILTAASPRVLQFAVKVMY